MNLLSKDVQKQVMAAMKEGQALGRGMECKSMTAALNIPDPDVPEAVPVRSKEHPMGLPELLGDHVPAGRENQAARLKTANKLLEFGFDVMDVALDRGAVVLPENPEGSHFWRRGRVKKWRSRGCKPWKYDGCCFSGARCKHQRIDTQAEEITRTDATCKHVHDQHEWKKARNAAGHLEYATAPEAEYTAPLVFHSAPLAFRGVPLVVLSATLVFRGAARCAL